MAGGKWRSGGINEGPLPLHLVADLQRGKPFDDSHWATHCGQTHSAGGHAGVLGGGEVDGGSASSSCRQSGNAAARRRLARKPKKRTRMKPRGNVCSRKRRRNSSAVSVISRGLPPCA